MHQKGMKNSPNGGFVRDPPRRMPVSGSFMRKIGNVEAQLSRSAHPGD
jgi:hypothetical protein